MPTQWKPGQSGNPSGRRAIAVDVRSQMQDNAAKGVDRMREILFDDNAFGKDGWLSGKEQIAMAALAMDRGFGRSENVSVTHTHSGTVGLNVRSKLKEISEKLPERIAQQRTIDAKAEEAELVSDDDGVDR